MKRTASLYISLSFICLMIIGCSTSRLQKETNIQTAKHIILIGSDGFGAYAFAKSKTPNLRKMMQKGAYSLKARAVLPSSSAVNWASMIMGSGSELHGYTTWGSQKPELPSRVIGADSIYPTIFSLIDQQMPNAKKGVSYTWPGIGYLFEKSLVDLDFNGKEDPETVAKALEVIVKEKPALMFIHLTHPDNEGHDIGHDTKEYYEAVEKVDALVGEIMATLEQNGLMDDTVILFTSDHGGIDKGHGGKTLLEVEIPWIVYGKNIPAKGELKSSIVTYDTAATITYLLGLAITDFWRGKPITEILKNDKKTSIYN